MIPKCKKKFHWNVKKKENVRKYFRLSEYKFHPSPFSILSSIPLSFTFSLEKVVALEGFSERTWLAFPSRVSFQLSKITGGDRDGFCDCASRPAHRASSRELVTKNTHEMNPELEREEKKKKKKKRWKRRNKRSGRRKGEKEIAGRG